MTLHLLLAVDRWLGAPLLLQRPHSLSSQRRISPGPIVRAVTSEQRSGRSGRTPSRIHNGAPASNSGPVLRLRTDWDSGVFRSKRGAGNPM